MIDERIKLLKLMDPIKWENTLNYKFGNNDNIQTALIKAIPEAVRIAKPIAPYFKGSNDIESLANIHKFIRKHLGYRRDPKGDQLIKMPNRFLLESGDCKSNALFIFAIAKNLGIPIDFKFVNYALYKGKIPSHVYNIAFNKKNNKFVTIDGTSSKFNIEKKPTYSKTTNFMRVYTLSDNMSDETIGKPKKKQVVAKAIKKVAAKVKQPIKKIQAAAKKVADKKPLKTAAQKLKKVVQTKNIGKKVLASPARAAFLALVLLNFRGIASKLKSANQSELSKKWVNLGGDFKALQKNINTGANKKPLLGGNISDDEIGLIGATTTAATFAAATPIFIALEKFLGKIEAVKNSASVKAAEKIINKNPKIKAGLTKLKGKAREQLVKEVANRTGQTPAQVEQFVTDAKEVINPTEDKPQEDPGNKPGMSTQNKLLIGAAVLGLGYAAFSKPSRAARR